jgi:uncharacterized protein YbjT (DUF2867 family)
MKKILILGGTGFVGSALCEQLVRKSGGGAWQLTVPTRQRQRGQHLQMLPGVQLVQSNLYHDAELARLVAGHDAVVNLVARLHGTPTEFAHTHAQLPRRLALACQTAGVMRVVHVSALGADVDAPSDYQRSKAAGEAVLRHSGLAVTLLRPSVIFGVQDQFMNLFAKLQALLPIMPLAGYHARFQPVWVHDVAQAIVQSLVAGSTIGCTFECAGPSVYRLSELVRMAGQWSGHPRPVVPLPHALAHLQALVLEHLPGKTLMSRDNLASMARDNIHIDGMPGLLALGITPTSIETVMPQALGHDSFAARMDAWRVKAGRS